VSINPCNPEAFHPVRLRARHLSHIRSIGFRIFPDVLQLLQNLSASVHWTSNPRRRSRYRCLIDHSTKYTRRLASPGRCGFSGTRRPDLLGKYPLYADILPLIIGAEPSNCWLLLGAALEPLPASLYHPVSPSFTARHTVGETMFGLTSFLSSAKSKSPVGSS